MYGPSFTLGEIKNKPEFFSLELSRENDPLPDNLDSEKIKVYWDNDCSGIVYLEEDIQFKDTDQASSGYYSFDSKKQNLQKLSIPPNIATYKQSPAENQIQVYSQ